MTEQKYRAVVRTADGSQLYGTLTNIESTPEEITATFTQERIERPVQATDESVQMCDCGAPLAVCAAAFGRKGESVTPHSPTREQIAEALWRNEDPARHNRDFIEADPLIRADHLEAADAVLGLIQNGADR